MYLNNESLGMHGVNAAHITRFLPCIFIQDTENVDMNLHNNLIVYYHLDRNAVKGRAPKINKMHSDTWW